MDARIAQRQAANAAASTGTYQYNTNSNTGPAKKDGWSFCSCCGGKGYTERYDQGKTYQIKNKEGVNTGTTSSQRITCSCCHGTGR